MEDDQTAAQQIRSSTDDFLTVLRGSHAILYDDDEFESVVPLNPFHEYWPDPNDEVKSKPK